MAGTSRGKQKAGAAGSRAAASGEQPEQPDGQAEPDSGAPAASDGEGASRPVPGSPERDQRPPSTTVLPSEAGPLVPTDIQKVNKPEDGVPESSTNTVAANAAQRSVPGSNFVRIHNEAGDELQVDDLFSGPEGASRMVTVRERVFQTFTYPHARTETTQLLYPAGARVPMWEAERFKASVKALLTSA